MGWIRPDHGYEEPDPDVALDVVPNISTGCAGTVALSNAFGFGGMNAVLALARQSEHARLPKRRV